MMPEGMNTPDDTVLILNQTSPLLLSLAEQLDTPLAELCAKQILTLATVAQRPLTADEMHDFLKSGYEVLEKALGKV